MDGVAGVFVGQAAQWSYSLPDGRIAPDLVPNSASFRTALGGPGASVVPGAHSFLWPTQKAPTCFLLATSSACPMVL